MPHKGVPIGNLTSQVFANIYLNEFDRFIAHAIKPLRYLRYGDDFIVLGKSREELIDYRKRAQMFLKDELRLAFQPKNDIIVKTRHGIHFLGVELFSHGRRLRERAANRAVTRMQYANLGSYHGLVAHHQKLKAKRIYTWQTLAFLEYIL